MKTPVRFEAQSWKPRIGLLIKNPHFWANLVITFILIIIYRSWPWSPWQLEQGPWYKVSWLSALNGLGIFEYNIHFVGLLFLIPIIYGVIVFKFWGALVFTLLTLISVFPLTTIVWSSFTLRLTNLVFLLFPIIIVLLIYIELELLKKNRTSLIRERQKYTSLVLAAQERERQRIAQELHDETIQTLIAIAKRAESISSPEKKTDIMWIRDGVTQTIDDLRRISLDLRPGVLDSMGLISAIRWLVDRTNVESGIKVQLTVDGTPGVLDSSTEITVFRVVQEALNNVKNHSNASQVIVSLEFGSRFLRLNIRDNGKGFLLPEKLNSLASSGKLGLIGMQERIMSLGGTFEISSRPGEGTQLIFQIPTPAQTPG